MLTRDARCREPGIPVRNLTGILLFVSKVGARLSRASPVVLAALVLLLAGVVFAIHFVKSCPLIFNESLWEHAHCMPQAGLSLRTYALDHGGQFPTHTNGYGDALLLLGQEGPYYFLTGPGHDTRVFEKAWASKSNVDEALCGRVYVQGLSETNDPRIVTLFDKVAAPPDHVHFPRRLWAGFVREVCFIHGSWRSVSVRLWPAFASEQIDLLVEAGFTREHAQKLHDEIK